MKPLAAHMLLVPADRCSHTRRSRSFGWVMPVPRPTPLHLRCRSRQFPDLPGAQRYQEQKNRDAGRKGDQAAPVVISHLHLPLARNPGTLVLVEVPHDEQRLDRRWVRPAFRVNDKNKAPPTGRREGTLRVAFIYCAMRPASSACPRALLRTTRKSAFNRAETQ
jgi:hypothetical protein